MSGPGFRVREATEDDATVIHALGANVPELNVGGMSGAFPDLADLEDDISDSEWVVVENKRGNVVGFCCGRRNDTDRTSSASACLVYLFIEPSYRYDGLAKKLTDYLLFKLAVMGVKYVYAWANPTSGVVEFFEKQGFEKGKTCVWMDCDLSGPLWEPTP